MLFVSYTNQSEAINFDWLADETLQSKQISWISKMKQSRIDFQFDDPLSTLQFEQQQKRR